MAIICALLLFVMHFGDGQGYELAIEVENIKKSGGNFMVAVFDRPEKFMSDQACSSLVTPVGSGGSQKLRLTVNKPGVYAVCMFQDLNGNGKLDRNRLGIPSEPYGFSNNPATFWGPPDFDETSFQFKGEKEEAVIIRLK